MKSRMGVLVLGGIIWAAGYTGDGGLGRIVEATPSSGITQVLVATGLFEPFDVKCTRALSPSPPVTTLRTPGPARSDQRSKQPRSGNSLSLWICPQMLRGGGGRSGGGGEATGDVPVAVHGDGQPPSPIAELVARPRGAHQSARIYLSRAAGDTIMGRLGRCVKDGVYGLGGVRLWNSDISCNSSPSGYRPVSRCT
jgi:hypothetical protein